MLTAIGEAYNLINEHGIVFAHTSAMQHKCEMMPKKPLHNTGMAWKQ